MIVFLVLIYLPLRGSPSDYNVSNNRTYYKNMNIVIIGRCCTISSTGEWSNLLFIGELSHAGVHASDTWLEGITILVYNKSYAKGFVKLRNTIVNIDDGSGIFFWGARKQFGAGPIPPVVLVWCHSEILWITSE